MNEPSFSVHFWGKCAWAGFGIPILHALTVAPGARITQYDWITKVKVVIKEVRPTLPALAILPGSCAIYSGVPPVLHECAHCSTPGAAS